MATQNTKTSSLRENVEESEGLAPIARLILKEGFRTPEFQVIYKDVLVISNKIAKGDQVPGSDLDETIGKVESHLEKIDEYYSEEVQDIMRNYFIRLNQRLREWHVKNKTPRNLEELEGTA